MGQQELEDLLFPGQVLCIRQRVSGGHGPYPKISLPCDGAVDDGTWLSSSSARSLGRYSVSSKHSDSTRDPHVRPQIIQKLPMVYEASSQIAVHCSKPESRSVPWHHIACNEAASRNLNSVYLQRGCFQHPYIQALKEKVLTKQQHGWTWCDVTMRWPWAAFQPVTS